MIIRLCFGGNLVTDRERHSLKTYNNYMSFVLKENEKSFLHLKHKIINIC